MVAKSCFCPASYLRASRRRLFCTLGAMLAAVAVARAQPPAPAAPPPLEISKDTVLDPARIYGRIVIKQSGITIDGRGAWVIGATRGDPKDYQEVGVSAKGVSKVTLMNLNIKGWQTGLKVEDGDQWLIENSPS